MLTTKRSDVYYATAERAGAGIDLLERKAPTSYKEYITPETEVKESFEEAKARMQKNLDRIMNYERFAEESASASVITPAVTSETVETIEETVAPVMDVVEEATDEDLMPTSTTIQFGDGQIEQVYDDLNKQKRSEGTSYHLNKKGKILVTLYALAVTVILALIVLNTGVLASLRSGNQLKAQALDAKVAEYNMVNEELESISSNDYVIDKAVNDFGMIKK